MVGNPIPKIPSKSRRHVNRSGEKCIASPKTWSFTQNAPMQTTSTQSRAIMGIGYSKKSLGVIRMNPITVLVHFSSSNFTVLVVVNQVIFSEPHLSYLIEIDEIE